jgi:hypothetical protein
MQWLTTRYRRDVRLAVSHRWITIGIGMILFLVAIYLAFGGVIGSEFLPHLDEGAIWVRGTMAPSTGGELQQRHIDLAHSLQGRLEQVLEHLVGYQLRTTGLRRLCLAGGTFMNCVANGKLVRLPGVDDMFVQPASHDAGTAVGAAALSWIRRGGQPMLRFGSVALGTQYADDEMAHILHNAGIRHRRLDDDELIEVTALRLAAQQIAGWFRGRMEFGSRALGMRSVLASPVDANMRDRINQLKGREEFRPVAPIVTAEAFDRFFDGHRNRYMCSTAIAREEAKRLVPSAVHVDGTARVQTVWRRDDALLHALLCRFEALAGVPVLINTSLNMRGRPIVESPHEALSCLYTTSMDFLVLGHLIQPPTGQRFRVGGGDGSGEERRESTLGVAPQHLRAAPPTQGSSRGHHPPTAAAPSGGKLSAAAAPSEPLCVPSPRVGDAVWPRRCRRRRRGSGGSPSCRGSCRRAVPGRRPSGRVGRGWRS